MRARFAVAVAIATIACGLMAAPAFAKAPDPCRVLKRSEIQSVLGGTVPNGKKGLTTPVSVSCEYKLEATADRPKGTLTVHVMFTGAKAAYDGIKKVGLYEPVAGLPNSLYSAKASVVDVLEGDRLLGVQGGFIDSTRLPLQSADVETELVELVKDGAKRV